VLGAHLTSPSVEGRERNVSDDAADVLKAAAEILDAVNNVNQPGSKEAVKEQIEFLRTLSRGTLKAARMEPGVAVALSSALRGWAYLARTDPDLMNRVGGPQMHRIARRIVSGDLKDEN